ncbi:MAG TPA: [protein-PII] uridylyltransferase [Verrucomicrobiales bacterium]|nr:[protein-PII] uridylyltransferase [Verrucomicrobiales bacterium]
MLEVGSFSIASLDIPADSSLAKELPRLKRHLKSESTRLQEWHREGADGREVCAARSAVIDTLLATLFDWTLDTFEPKKRERKLTMSLVAIGGYGRSELNPHSDIDFMLLHSGTTPSVTRIFNHELIEKLTGPEGLIYTLYDLGMKVGYSVRNIQDAVNVANDDMQTKTSLIESRLISGDAGLFEQFQKRVEVKCVRSHIDDYLQMRIADQDARRVKFGNSALLQAPNIKNGCGGLRDYQNLLWMTHFKYGTRTLAELEAQEMIRPNNRAQLEEGYGFLLRVRNELHYQTKRPSDDLHKALQPKVAWQLGYKDRSPARRLEAFMRDLYMHMRRIHLITRMVERRLALRPKPSRRIPSLRSLFGGVEKQETLDGFQVIEGELVPVSSRVFKDQPRRLMRVFLHAQQRGLEFHPDLIQLLRDNVSLVDESFIKDAEVHETFLEILNQRGNVAPAVRAMHEVDLLGRFIPEFGRMTCMVQHEFFHAYAADEHTLICLEKLDQVWDADERPFTDYTHILQDIDLPYLLYLALFLHDAGKGMESGDHVKNGAVVCLQVGERLGLSPRRLSRLRFLVDSHLLMAEVSQRRDIDSPTVIRQFAEAVQDEENLAMLTLLTFADSLGTSDDLWNDFKNTLLQSLYRRTDRRLASGEDYEAAEKNRLAKLKFTLRDELPPHLSEEELEAHFNHLTPRYFRAHSIRHILVDLEQVNLFLNRVTAKRNEKVLEPIINWHDRPARGYTSLKVCTWDRPGLFTTISGALAATGLNILSARVFSRSDGIIIDTFFVVNAKTGGLAKRAERDKFSKLITQALLLDGDSEFEEQAMVKREDTEEWQLPIRIRIDTQSVESRTIVEVESEDRLGLLHRISNVLTQHDLNIHVARISTEKGAAIDTFYVRTKSGGKPTDENKLDELKRALETELG